MKRHKWHADQWLALLGVAATGLGAYFVVMQIRDARDALHSNNIYLADKDVIDAFDRILETQREALESEAGGDNKVAAQKAADVGRAVIRFDSIFGAIGDLKATGGLGLENWKLILSAYCPHLSKSGYRLAKTGTSSAKAICERDKTLWEAGQQ